MPLAINFKGYNLCNKKEKDAGLFFVLRKQYNIELVSIQSAGKGLWFDDDNFNAHKWGLSETLQKIT